MVKIKGKKYKRVAMKKDGGCPKGSTAHRRGKTSRKGCYEPLKGKAKKRGKKKRRR